jgi:hypothetical protein
MFSDELSGKQYQSKLKSMYRIIFLISACVLCSSALLFSQKSKEKLYSLELLDKDNSVVSHHDVSLYTKRNSNYISISFGDKSIVTKVINDGAKGIKFQLAEERENELINQNFIGLKGEDNIIRGDYMVSVDGMFQEKTSGKFLFTLQNEEISGILDEDYQYSVGFPMGITVVGKVVSFDLEFVPSIAFNRKTDLDQEAGHNQEADLDRVALLVHPGILYPVRKDLTLGMRLAFELGEAGRYGFTPLINFGNILPNSFVEVVLPVRFGSGIDPALTLGIHIGMGF